MCSLFAVDSSEADVKQTPQLTIAPRSGLGDYDRIDIDLPEARVGSVRCRFMGEKVILYSILVCPEFQGNHYGTAAIELLKDRFQIIVADRVRFTAREFWEKMGFKPLENGNWEYRRLP